MKPASKYPIKRVLLFIPRYSQTASFQLLSFQLSVAGSSSADDLPLPSPQAASANAQATSGNQPVSRPGSLVTVSIMRISSIPIRVPQEAPAKHREPHSPSASYSAIFLREFIEYLAAETDATRIHILGYSAGTRLVVNALHQLALANQHRSTEEIRRELRLGNVILVGSDVDRGIFGTFLLDGLLNVQEHMTIYESPRDKALGMALFSLGNERVGQLDPDDLTPEAKAFLLRSDALALVSVESAPGFDHGNGHSYFRDSPWVSTDLLVTLLHDLRPADRGLAQDPASGIWGFPEDYLARVARAIRPPDP